MTMERLLMMDSRREPSPNTCQPANFPATAICSLLTLRIQCRRSISERTLPRMSKPFNLFHKSQSRLNSCNNSFKFSPSGPKQANIRVGQLHMSHKPL